MSAYRPPLDEIGFVLDNVAGLGPMLEWPAFSHVDREVVDGVLSEGARFMSDVVAPLDRRGDVEGAVLREDGSVVLPDGFREAYARYVAAGWNGVATPRGDGGHGFPMVVATAVQEMLTSACLAFSLCPMLTQSAALLVRHHGTEAQRAVYLDNLVSGRWTGTMDMTEPQAGSDLSAVRSRAERRPDGSFRVFGSKIFITWGEHDLAENIVHFVLARAAGGPAGTAGLSLFVVPKFLPTAAGAPGDRNDVSCVSIEHKVGIRASPTCVLSYGERGGAVGFLLGDLHQGLRAMFTMMNHARLQIGVEGLGIAERALQQAGAFAAERRQGTDLNSVGAGPVPIVAHPDVRRMLATMLSSTAAMRGLIYDAAARIDAAEHHPDSATAEKAAEMVRLLTPLAKAWCSDEAVAVTSLGMQVHGGMGYIEETGAAQLWRDARITPIYEGTNGIQAIDLVMRSLPASGGRAIRTYLKEIDEVAASARAGHADLAAVGHLLSSAAAVLSDAAEWLLGPRDPSDRLAAASPFLRMFGLVAGARYLTASAVAAAGDPSRPDMARAKVATASFYATQLLPAAAALLPAVTAGADNLPTTTLLEAAR